MEPVLSLALLLLAGAAVTALLIARRWALRRRFFRRPVAASEESHRFAPKKPPWVRDEVVRLAALMRDEDGCRKISDAFNSLYKRARDPRKRESVGKTYVADVRRQSRLQIGLVRSRIKNRPRRQGPRGLVYALDITFVGPRQTPVLGILDHGTRALLCLGELKTRTTIGVLRTILDVVERFGVPRFVRTDNEKILASPFLTAALEALGIQHQRIDPFCPWQNGRIERLFATLKERLGAWWLLAGVPNDVQPDLDTFRTWYNHARSHQSLAGITPAMAWAGVSHAKTTPRFFQAWDGILTGFVSPT